LPNITIYVSEKDQEIYKKARGLEDSLSKVIAAALKIYLKEKEANEGRS
jgi:hypothetical protein